MAKKNTSIIRYIYYLIYAISLSVASYFTYYFYNCITIKNTSSVFILTNNKNKNPLLGIISAILYLKHFKRSQILSNIETSSLYNDNNSFSISVFANYEQPHQSKDYKRIKNKSRSATSTSNHLIKKENNNKGLINIKTIINTTFYFQEIELFSYVSVQNHFSSYKIFKIDNTKNDKINCDIEIESAEIVNNDLNDNKITYNYTIENMLGMNKICDFKQALLSLYYYMLGKKELIIGDNYNKKAFRMIIIY